MIYYSCDSHVVEPAVVFEGLEERFGERAPRILHDPDGRRGDFLKLGTVGRPVTVARFGIAGHRLDDPATHELIAQGYAGMNKGVFDPEARMKEQEQDGIVGEVMYPSLNMLTFSHADRAVVHAIFQRHNDWIRDYCSYAPERLIGVACIPLPDIEESIAELQRVAKMGIRGIAIPCAAPVDKPYSDPLYEPFWSACDEIGLPITMHIFTGASWGMNIPEHWGPILSYALAQTAIQNTMGQIILSGVNERHPNLKFICGEFETGWLGHFLGRLDHAAYRTPEAKSKDLQTEPSEYFRRSWYATFEDDEAGIRTRDMIGVDNLLWGNDYPHHDAIWPHSMEVLSRIMQGVPEDEVEKMTSGNVMKLYNIKLPAEVAA
jgi:uncharacterized protein